MEIKTYVQEKQDREFYGVMGPYFASRFFYKHFGEYLFNDKNSVWFVMFDKNSVAGFCAAFYKKDHVYLNYEYVFEEYKSKGVAEKLMKARESHLKGMTDLRIMFKDGNEFIQVYKKRGFKELKRVGKQYSLFQKTI